MDMIKVAANSKTSGVAGSIAHAVRENGRICVQGIGAGAVNQMVKATIMAKRYLVEEGASLIFTPDFTLVDISGWRYASLFLQQITDHHATQGHKYRCSRICGMGLNPLPCRAMLSI